MKQYSATVTVTDVFGHEDRIDVKRSLEEARLPQGLSLRVQHLRKVPSEGKAAGRRISKPLNAA